MKFLCNKQDLSKAVNIVSRASSSNFQKSILECILIEARDNQVILRATDTMLSMKASCFSEVSQSGICAVPSRLLSEIINKFPDGEISFERIDTGIEIVCNNARVHLQEMNADEFPEFPEIENGIHITLNEQQLKKMISGTVFSAYIGEDKPIFTGILIESEPGKINFVGIDGIRLALRSAAFDGKEGINVVVPAKALKEAVRIFEDGDGEISLYVNDRAFLMIKQDIQVYTRLLEGDYIKYRSIISDSYTTRVRVEVKMLEQALERVAILARNDSNNQIRLAIQMDEMVISSNSEYGTAQDEVPIFTEGEPLTIAFNVRYLLDVLKNVEDSEIFMEFSGRLKPCVMKPVEGNSYLYLVVPVNERR